MRIVLNGLSAIYPISGVGQYTLNLCRSLEPLLGPENVFCFGQDFRQKDDLLSDREGYAFLSQIQYRLKKGLRKIPGLTPFVHFLRNRQFQSFTQRLKPSLYHETKYALFDFEGGPSLTTIYDLSFLRHPEWHPIDRVKHFEKYCLKKLSQVEAIITISEFSRKEILNLLNIDPAKIHVTPLGIDQSFRPGRNGLKGLPRQYILSLGNIEPRKNLSRLMAAYQSLHQSLKRRYPLVIAGAEGWDTKEVKEILSSFQRDEKPIFTGYIPQSLLPDLYRGASLFVYPSLYEGFGLPILEAMASGVPVITSCSTSLPEVAGDAGVLVNPYDVDHLKEAMMELLEDEKKRGEMVKEGIARAKLFSWEKCARQTLSVYEEVLGKGI